MSYKRCIVSVAQQKHEDVNYWFFVCCLIAVVSVLMIIIDYWPYSKATTFSVLGARPISSVRGLTLEEMERTVNDVVVLIVNQADDRDSQGSAVVVAPTLVLTTCHIGNEDVTAFVDGQAIGLRLVAAHRDSDRCIFKTDRPMPHVVPGVRLVSSLSSKEPVYAFGYPHYTPTLSAGVFTNVFIDENGARKIRTNARISPGNSGGGLFDRYGNLLGIMHSHALGEVASFALVAEDWWEPSDN
jgi:S1-C subfamily serine protease